MVFDADRYYTPEDTALRILERSELSRIPATCADSTCGIGRLLEAANKVYGVSKCLGFDNDRNAIKALRKKWPDWVLSAGDLLNPNSYRASQLAKSATNTDLLILNPPFSQGKQKFVELLFDGELLRGSMAMAYLLRSFELFRPEQGAIAVVPESLLHAEVDAKARAALSRKWTIKQIAELTTTTFSGARAHACAVQFLPSAIERKSRSSNKSKAEVLEVEIVRGALPVHLMKESDRGVAFVHTKDFEVLQRYGPRALQRTKITAKGQVQGSMVLLPRVGVPLLKRVAALRLASTVQLSDCVIAIKCRSVRDAEVVVSRIRRSFGKIVRLYKGTGARYVTIERLTAKLAQMNIVG